MKGILIRAVGIAMIGAGILTMALTMVRCGQSAYQKCMAECVSSMTENLSAMDMEWEQVKAMNPAALCAKFCSHKK